MPTLKDFRTTKKIVLPTFPDSEVEIYDSLLVGDMVGFSGKFEEANVEAMIAFVPKMIKSWNFTDEKGETLPISSDNLGFLKAEDLTFLLQEITNFANEAKKKLKA